MLHELKSGIEENTESISFVISSSNWFLQHIASAKFLDLFRKYRSNIPHNNGIYFQNILLKQLLYLKTNRFHPYNLIKHMVDYTSNLKEVPKFISVAWDSQVGQVHIFEVHR